MREMKRLYGRVCSFVLCLAVLASALVGPAFAAEQSPKGFRDTAGHWSAAAADRWSGLGVFSGDESGDLDPDGEMGRAEFAAVLNSLTGYAEEAGTGAGEKISRERAAVMLCQAFGIAEPADTALAFSDADAVSAWAKGSVAALAQRGVVRGVGGNSFAPGRNLTRAEAVTMLDNMVGAFVAEKDSAVTGEQKKAVIVAAGGVKLDGVSAAESVVVAPCAVGATLTVTGKSKTGTIIVGAPGVKVVVDKDAQVGKLVSTLPVEVEGEGSIDEKDVPAPVNRAKTPLGTFTGRQVDRDLVKYTNIPYATYERWQRPVPVTTASAEDLDARDEAATVTNQFRGASASGEEGTLTLDIYVNPTGSAADKGVLVWNTCGGGTGSNSNTFDPSAIVMENPNLIVAVVNIRVGYYGSIDLQCFSDYDSYTIDGKNPYDASNNLMRLDYLESLKWVQANIAGFGGDPHNVTIGGQSAGAANASAMLLMEQAHDYFQKVIMESGVAIDRISVMPLSESEYEAGQFQKYAKGAMDGNAPVAAEEADYVTTIAEGLNLGADSFATAQSGLSVGGVGAYPKGCQGKTFSNVADGVVIPVTTEERWAAIEKAAKKGIQILVGTTGGEYDRDLAGKDAAGAKADIMSANWGKLAEADPATKLPTVNGKQASAEAEALFQGYVARSKRTGTEYERDEVTAYKDFKNDINQKVSAVMIAEAFAQNGSNAYLFSFEWYAPNQDGIRAGHGSEKNALYPGAQGFSGPEELGKAMRKAWASFILDGDPNADNSYFDAAKVEWKPYSKDAPNTMVFDAEMKCVKGQRTEDVESLMPLFEEYACLRK